MKVRIAGSFSYLTQASAALFLKNPRISGPGETSDRHQKNCNLLTPYNTLMTTDLRHTAKWDRTHCHPPVGLVQLTLILECQENSNFPVRSYQLRTAEMASRDLVHRRTG